LELFNDTGFLYKNGMGSGGTTKRMQVIFSGRVQGVGFRYTVYQTSEAFKVAGFVCNLPDGRVEVVAEGNEQTLSDFLNDIRSSHVGRYITKEQIRWLAATDKFDRFRIS
jgi:acylphosphatase